MGFSRTSAFSRTSSGRAREGEILEILAPLRDPSQSRSRHILHPIPEQVVWRSPQQRFSLEQTTHGV